MAVLVHKAVTIEWSLIFNVLLPIIEIVLNNELLGEIMWGSWLDDQHITGIDRDLTGIDRDLTGLIGI